jgi:HD superfamily phosphohydrolase
LDRLSPEVVDELHSLRTEVQGLRATNRSEIQRLTKLLIDSWTKTSQVTSRKLFFDDPVWGHTVIEEELAVLFRHPLVQRLNYIKQLSFAYLVFPSATHTRLSHSLGTCRLAEMALTTVFRNDVIYTEGGLERIDLSATERRELILKAKTAALLHDLGHLPFGHALDRLVGFHDPVRTVTSPDKYYSVIYLQKYLSNNIPGGLRVDDLKAILTHDTEYLSGWDTFVADLIDSPLDVDRMDFLARDAHMSGLLMGFNCAEALIERICPLRVDDQIYLTFHESCLPYVKDLLFAREKMYVNCYEDPKKLAAERIFCRLIQNLVEENDVDMGEAILLTDDQATAVLGLAALGSEENSALLHALVQGTDYPLAYEVGLAGGEGTEVGSWKRARDRTGMGRVAYVEKPRQWEKDIALAAGLRDESWHVLAVVPDHKTGQPPGLVTQILQETPDGLKVGPVLRERTSLLAELKQAQEPRSRIRVFADSRLTRGQRDAVAKAAGDLLG